MKVHKDHLQSIVRKITDGWKILPVSLPQAGLGQLKLNDGAFHEPFYLGEFPVTKAHLTITLPDGKSVEGAAIMMSDDIEHVESLALCDAILTHELTGCDAIAELVIEGEALAQQETDKRHAMLAKTRVDFSLLDDAGGDDED